MQPQVEVEDIVVTSVKEAYETTKRLFGLETSSEVIPFMKVVIACRSLSAEAHAEVVDPIVNGILAHLALDPVNSEDHRARAAEYSELIAMAISDATQFIYQQMQQDMQRRAQATAAIQSGNGGLLKP